MPGQGQTARHARPSRQRPANQHIRRSRGPRGISEMFVCGTRVPGAAQANALFSKGNQARGSLKRGWNAYSSIATAKPR